MSTLDVTRAFSGGELAPGLRARADLDLYRRGLETGRNVIVHKVGGVSARPGTTFVGALDGERRFIGVTFDDASDPPEAFLLELGDGTLRFWQGDELLGYTSAGAWANATAYTAGTVVTHSSVDYLCLQSHTSATALNRPGDGSAWATVWSVVDGVYEWPAPWDDETLWEVQRQSDYRVVRFTHPGFAPQTLTYLGSGLWSLADTVFAVIPGIAPAADDEVVDDLGITGESSGSGVAFTIAPIIREEGSSTRTIGRADDWVALNFNADDYAALFSYLTNEGALSMTWTKVDKPKVRGYVIWCRYTNDGGYITCVIETNKGSYTLSRNQLGVQGTTPTPGQPYSEDWRGGDTGRAERSWVPSEPTLVDAVPDDDPPFNASGEFPSAIGTHQQRLMLGGSVNAPDVAFGSRAASPDDFTVSTPLQDDDSVSWRQIGPQVRRIRHLLEAGERLWQLSSLGAELIRGGQDGILRPGEVNPLMVSAVGAARVPQAIEVLDAPVYARANGQSIWTVDEDAGAVDLTQLASHLFADSTVKDWAVQVWGADDILWVVLADGALRSLTLDRVNGVVAWTRHDSDPLADEPAVFASVAVTRENGVDILYAAVERDTLGFSLERFRADDVHMDAGLSADVVALDLLDNPDSSAVTVVESEAAGVLRPTGVPAETPLVRLAEDGTNASHFWGDFSVGEDANDQQQLSFYVRADERTKISAQVGPAYAQIDLATGLVDDDDPDPASAGDTWAVPPTVTDAGNGWWFVTMTLQYATSSPPVTGLAIQLSDGVGWPGTGAYQGTAGYGVWLYSDIIASGLDALEGRAVVVVADGTLIAHPLLADPLVVTGGEITLPEGSYTEVIVGLPIVADIETLAVEPSGGSTNRNTGIPTGGLVAWVERSGPFYVGPRLPDSPSALSDSRVTMERPVLYDDDKNPIADGALRTGVVKGVLRAAWGDGHIAIRHVGPEPLTIHALAPQGLGGGR